MSKHTSGEWRVTPEENGNEYGVDSGKWGICICADAPGDGSAEANARLIAAAPELLSALEALLDYVGDERLIDIVTGEPMGFEADEITSARDAIAKATGNN